MTNMAEEKKKRKKIKREKERKNRRKQIKQKKERNPALQVVRAQVVLHGLNDRVLASCATLGRGGLGFKSSQVPFSVPFSFPRPRVLKGRPLTVALDTRDPSVLLDAGYSTRGLFKVAGSTP